MPPNAPGSAPVTFAALPTEVDECVDVSDTRAGSLGKVCAGGGLPHTFTYDLDAGPFSAPTECGDQVFDNTATFLATPPVGTGQTGSDGASATVTVECTTPPPDIVLKDTFIRKDKSGKSKSGGKGKGKGSEKSKGSKKSGKAPDNRHANEGANPRLELERDHEVLLDFDLGADFVFSDVTSAQVVLTIDPDLGSTGWGKKGKSAKIHHLKRDFEEGNGINTGPEVDQTRGTGEGATWECAADQDISNNKGDCAKGDKWKGAKKRGKAVDKVKINNGLTGTVTFDVTKDVMDGRTRWVIHVNGKKKGSIVFFSQEGAPTPDDAPRLVITP